MKTILTVCLMFSISIISYSQEPFIQFNKSSYQQGDTITINCQLEKYRQTNVRFATLYLFIEKINTKQSWIYRYPIMNGNCEPTLVIDSSLHDGKYAFAFQVRKSFFSLQGMAENGDEIDLNYSMLTRNKNSLVDKIKTDANGNFSVKGILFEDSCLFAFYPAIPNYQNQVKINIITPLDSAFVSEYNYTQIITLGKTDTVTEADKTYKVDVTGLMGKTSLPDVIVEGKKKKKIELFNEQFSSGLFKNGEARVFDGLESNTIAQSVSIFNFLQGRVAGLQIMPRNGSYILQWRGPSNFRGGSNVDVFIDEIRIDLISDNMINPADVAMIKAYPPPAFLSPGGQRAAIAIYTKRGEFQPDTPNGNRFKVFGYSPIETLWK